MRVPSCYRISGPERCARCVVMSVKCFPDGCDVVQSSDTIIHYEKRNLHCCSSGLKMAVPILMIQHR
jgi:hypothetical protein